MTVKSEAKRQRLASALRENLKRRKALDRARRADTAAGKSGEEAASSEDGGHVDRDASGAAIAANPAALK